MVRTVGVVVRLLFGLALLVVPGRAVADVTLPNGLVVPRDSANGETQLYTFFMDQGEAIDWQMDAHDTPDTFSPLCDFTATLLLHEAGSSLGVGWYNVDPAAAGAPTEAQIYQVVPPGAPLGSVISGMNIRSDPNYAGGLIGFALKKPAAPPPHYSESKWNTVCNAGPCAATPGPWILAVKYQSVIMPNAYYLAFEDGAANAFGWANDGDYNDYVFLFTGIQCGGAGEPCVVEGQQGVCAEGLTECDSTGELSCQQLVEPSDETCDAVDNDCDGSFDEGDELCSVGLVCVRGNCVPECGEEFPCFGGDVCEKGLCVHPDCVGVECAEGKACRAGDCRAPCDGIVCPGEEVCRVGACLDPCAGVICGEGQVCDRGVCVQHCNCAGCLEDKACDRDSGKCVDPGCEVMSCDMAQVCVGGSCVDPCDDAVCPEGHVCQDGDCVEAPDGTGGKAPEGGTGGGGAAGAAAPGGDGGVSDPTGMGAAGDGRDPTPSRSGADADSGGCGTAAGRPPSGCWSLLLGLLYVLQRRKFSIG